ncbi:hypothetical protein FB451DRAFT_1267798, partial [Mycena latifolia]
MVNCSDYIAIVCSLLLVHFVDGCCEILRRIPNSHSQPRIRSGCKKWEGCLEFIASLRSRETKKDLKVTAYKKGTKRRSKCKRAWHNSSTVPREKDQSTV